MQGGIDPALIAALLVSLAFMSFLLAARLSAGGGSPAAVWKLLIALWLTIGLWVGLFVAIGRLLGTSQAGGLEEESRDLWQRILAASGPVRAWCFALAAIALGSFALFLRYVFAAMRGASPQEEKGGKGNG